MLLRCEPRDWRDSGPSVGSASSAACARRSSRGELLGRVERGGLASESDERLFERYRSGDLGALRALMERHHDDLMRFLTRLVGERAGAEDVFQETFLQVHLSAGLFDTTRRFRPWLFTIAANKGRDFLRRKVRRRTLDLSAPVGGASPRGESNGTQYVDLLEIETPAPDARLLSDETNRRVQGVLDSMPETLREILLLAYFQRLSYADIAEDLQIPLGTVKSRLHSAVATFAKRWTLATGERTGRGASEPGRDQ